LKTVLQSHAWLLFVVAGAALLVGAGWFLIQRRVRYRRLARSGADIERTVLTRAVGWHLEDRVLAYGNRTIVF